MMFTSKKRLMVAIAGVFSLAGTTAQAADFNATTTVQTTLEVTVIQDFDIGALFASRTTVGAPGNFGGVDGLTIAPDGTVTTFADGQGDVTLQQLGTPTPAQGSVDSSAEFTLILPATEDIVAGETDGTTATATMYFDPNTPGREAVELAHESGDPDVPSLYLIHFTADGVSDGTVTDTVPNDGIIEIEPDFGVTTFTFNIGATIVTEPSENTAGVPYEDGIYAGVIEVLAEY
ncbi:MAG: hypothetical protein AB8B63_02360 [Granulosicoccus sp.]